MQSSVLWAGQGVVAGMRVMCMCVCARTGVYISWGGNGLNFNTKLCHIILKCRPVDYITLHCCPK
jgi:hypothetical protein